MANKKNVTTFKNTELSYDDIQYIQDNFKSGCNIFGINAMTRKYNISPSVVKDILSGKIWPYVPNSKNDPTIYTKTTSYHNKEEIWKDVVGFEDFFMISNMGRIWSKRSKIIMKTNICQGGYKYIATIIGGVGGIKKTIFIHRMVAEAFIPNLKNKPFVNHIDAVKTHNAATNLEWVTHQENIDHAIVMDLVQRGEDAHSAILTEDDVRYIKNNFVLRCRTNGGKALGKKYGVDKSTIMHIIHGRTWKHIK